MSYYGDNTRWFVGRVVDINDPLKLDRVKVRIFGIHTEDTSMISTADLPWAQVAIPTTEGGTSGLGFNTQVKPMAQVFGFFMDGRNSQLPLVIGSIPKIESSVGDTKLAEGAALQLNGKSNIEKAFNFFISQEGGNFTVEQACGMIGNFCVESAASANNGDINPAAVSGFKDEGSFGIAQWNPAKAAGERLGKLITFSSSQGLSHTTLEAQLLFVKYELETFSYFGVGSLRKSETVEQATEVFQNKYERPRVDLAKLDQRIKFANEIFRKLGRGGFGDGT